MPKGIIVVYSGPDSPEHDEEYNEWYDTVHVPEVCSVPGVVVSASFQTQHRAEESG